MSFQITLRREGVSWALARAPFWPKFLGIDEGFAEGSALDIAQPPEHRDWVGERGTSLAKIFFEDESSAREALIEIHNQGWDSAELSAVPALDWNEEWKRNFEGAVVGAWHVIPPWKSPRAELLPLVIEPGAGFGTGTHETTRLCLEALTELDLQGKRVLDFGSGSGILSIAAALRGARVTGVEIDPLAVENARHNAHLNHVSPELCEFRAGFPETQFDFVIANILRPVLIEFADRLVNAVSDGGVLVLSGLLREDLEPIQRRFEPLFAARGGVRGEASARLMTRFCGDWMALTFAIAQRPVSRR